jgi:aquaporin Z
LPRLVASTLRAHWREYLIEGTGLGTFMLSALGFTLLLEHPASALHQAIPNGFARLALMGCAMGATLVALVYNPLGQRSGAHFNPIFTFTFWRLGKVSSPDAICYGAAQFAGGALGVVLLGLAAGVALGNPSVRFAVTVPGPAGVAAAFAGEVAIAFTQMLLVLCVSNSKRFNRFTGLFAAAGIAIYITLEAPISGMSMNPARTLASALGAGDYTALWLYFLAPLLGMLAAAELYLLLAGARRIHCAKLHHDNAQPCIFRCGWGEA